MFDRPEERAWISIPKEDLPAGGLDQMFFEAIDDEGKARVFMQTLEMVGQGTQRRVTHEVYRKPNGCLFPLPLDDADGEDHLPTSCVNRLLTTGSHAQNIYLRKAKKHPGWRMATKQDVLDDYRNKRLNREKRAAKAKVTDPREQAMRAAEIESVSKLVAEGMDVKDAVKKARAIVREVMGAA